MTIMAAIKRNFLQTSDMNVRKEIIRFSIAGTFVVATDFSIYYLLFHFLPFSIAKGISFTCAGIVGYLINKYWIFKHSRPSPVEIGRYVATNVLALGVNVVINHSILNVRPGAVWLALVIATALTSLLTFICFKWWVFNASFNMKDIFKWRLAFKERFLKLWRSNISPNEIALGVAIGVFIGITPLYGFHIIMATISAFTIKRVNKVAIFLGMNISLK